MEGTRRFTESGIEVQPVYEGPAPEREALGQFPYTRGIHPLMYRGKLWTMRQYAGYSTAEQSNDRYHYLLGQGVTGLSVAFDLPTQIGYDSDHPLAEGEVGKVGVAIDSMEDMERLFSGIDLGKVSVSMTINATAFILLAFYVAVARRRGTPLASLSGTVQNDILKEYAARGTYIYPPAPSMRLVTDVFDYCTRELPRWNSISISGYHIREAGATAVQELAFTLANGIAYVEAAQQRGMDINVFGKRLSFFFNAHNNLFEEAAKFRAARRLWAEIMKGLGATEPAALMLRFHTQTAGSTLTAAQPMNNITRVAIQALSAVLGGTQSLHTNGYDEALSLPTEQAAKVALRTQQILASESGVTDTADPLAGSFYVEALTDEVASAATALIGRIREMGGAVAAIERGFMQEEIAASAYRFQQEVEAGQRIVVGVNAFVDEKDAAPVAVFRVDEGIREKQVARLGELRGRRDNEAVARLTGELERRAVTDGNLMPLVVALAEEKATLGEIAGALRSAWGEYRP
jgi:methylmalonyl-CoA mutase N-terminal domain/subunit